MISFQTGRKLTWILYTVESCYNYPALVFRELHSSDVLKLSSFYTSQAIIASRVKSHIGSQVTSPSSLIQHKPKSHHPEKKNDDGTIYIREKI